MKKIIMIIVLLFSISEADISPKTVMKNVEKKLTATTTIRVEFEETYVWKLTGEKQTMKGELLMKGYDKFYVKTEDQLIVSDGKTLWTYTVPSNRVLIDILENSDEELLPRQILFQFTKKYNSRLAGEVRFNKYDCYIIHLTSESPDVLIPEIKVWVDKKEWIPRKIEQIDLDENSTIYILSEVELNYKLNDEIFKFKIPAGSEVIDMRDK